MHSFVLFLKCGFNITVVGENMIDACHRSGTGGDLKEIASYQENGGNVVQFAV